MEDNVSVDVDDAETLPEVTLEEIFMAESIERYPEKRIVVIDGEARFDPDARFASDNWE